MTAGSVDVRGWIKALVRHRVPRCSSPQRHIKIGEKESKNIFFPRPSCLFWGKVYGTAGVEKKDTQVLRAGLLLNVSSLTLVLDWALGCLPHQPGFLLYLNLRASLLSLPSYVPQPARLPS